MTATKPTCDGWCQFAADTGRPVTYIDDAGFAYCETCGPRRQAGGRRCRRLRPHELARLARGEQLAHY